MAQNRKARHDYEIDSTYEAGLVLAGTEVKSLRAGRASLVDGFAEVRDGEVWLRNVHIPEYDQGPGPTTSRAVHASYSCGETRSAA